MIESSLTLDLLGLVAVVILVLLNGFFVAAEFSLVSVRQTRITELVESGNARAETVQKALKNPDRVIAATQLGITLPPSPPMAASPAPNPTLASALPTRCGG